jgi:hypothetical protein
MCEKIVTLRASVAALKDLKPREVGTAGVKAAADRVMNDADAFWGSAAATLGSSLDDTLNAAAELEANLTNLGGQSSLGSAAGSIQHRIDDVTTTWEAMDNALSAPCPSS